ncbi:hypothetical protein AB0F72_13655 [Actinoplanes sp. NPDC023936]|uniref:hypothetical protein n=1 Tax=Actinoplanes sp. NPDC023936 TaxID=3154910 RepID=UPI0033FBF367
MLEFRVLGRLGVARDGTAVPLPAQQTSLLASLAHLRLVFTAPRLPPRLLMLVAPVTALSAGRHGAVLLATWDGLRRNLGLPVPLGFAVTWRHHPAPRLRRFRSTGSTSRVARSFGRSRDRSASFLLTYADRALVAVNALGSPVSGRHCAANGWRRRRIACSPRSDAGRAGVRSAAAAGARNGVTLAPTATGAGRRKRESSESGRETGARSASVIVVISLPRTARNREARAAKNRIGLSFGYANGGSLNQSSRRR